MDKKRGRGRPKKVVEESVIEMPETMGSVEEEVVSLLEPEPIPEPEPVVPPPPPPLPTREEILAMSVTERKAVRYEAIKEISLCNGCSGLKTISKLDKTNDLVDKKYICANAGNIVISEKGRTFPMVLQCGFKEQ